MEVRVLEEGEEHAYADVIAADEGRLLLRNNQTAHAAFSYRVPADATPPYTPHLGPQGHAGTPHPTGLPDGFVPLMQWPNLVTLKNAPFSRNDPWLPDGATTTAGNNVRAYADLVAPDGYSLGDLLSVITAPGAFDRTYDHAQPPDANSESRFPPCALPRATETRGKRSLTPTRR